MPWPLRALRAACWTLRHAPARKEPTNLVGASDPVEMPSSPVRFRVVCWNIQFGAGTEAPFFYDGGCRVHTNASTVTHTLERIAQVLREADADIVLLQEVDRGSDRTANIDQHAWLVRRLGVAFHTSTPYHQVPYVPHPPHAHLGGVNMHLSVFSRYPLQRGIRWALPLLREPWIRQLFNLRRAVLQVDVPLAGDRFLRLFNTHLSAFSRGDGTLGDQAARVHELGRNADLDGIPFVLTGDFNTLPPNDDPSRLGEDSALYADTPNPIAPWFEEWSSAVSLDQHAREPDEWRTMVPHAKGLADRAIDHAFAAGGASLSDARVLKQTLGISDHLPLQFTVNVA